MVCLFLATIGLSNKKQKQNTWVSDVLQTIYWSCPYHNPNKHIGKLPLCLRVAGNLFVVFGDEFLGSWFTLSSWVSITLQHNNKIQG